MVTHLLQAISLIIFLSWPSQSLNSQDGSYFILWNVGQGQWATLSTPSQCIHLDMGGEHIAWSSVQRECQNKRNSLLLSHSDWDHISFIRKAQYRLKNLCLRNKPLLPQKQKRFLKGLPRCPKSSLKEINFHFQPSHPQKESNDNSHIFGLHHFLIPGDSTAQMEKIWVRKLKPSLYKVLVLGHHGSKTSTSLHLLKSLPYIRQSITSSRKRKYGHPHNSIKSRLSQYGIPVLSTEDWGTIKFPIK